MRKLIPAVAIAAILVVPAAFAQTTKPGDVAPNPTSPGATETPSAQPAPPTEPSGKRLSPNESAAATGAPTLTEEEAKQWVDRAIYSSDDQNVGDVAAIQRDASGKVTELHADIGGFLGFGTTRVRLMPSQFKLTGDRVELNLAADEVDTLPTVTQ